MAENDMRTQMDSLIGAGTTGYSVLDDNLGPEITEDQMDAIAMIMNEFPDLATPDELMTIALQGGLEGMVGELFGEDRESSGLGALGGVGSIPSEQMDLSNDIPSPVPPVSEGRKMLDQIEYEQRQLDPPEKRRREQMLMDSITR
jgi:hypothetical protein